MVCFGDSTRRTSRLPLLVGGGGAAPPVGEGGGDGVHEVLVHRGLVDVHHASSRLERVFLLLWLTRRRCCYEDRSAERETVDRVRDVQRRVDAAQLRQTQHVADPSGHDEHVTLHLRDRNHTFQTAAALHPALPLVQVVEAGALRGARDDLTHVPSLLAICIDEVLAAVATGGLVARSEAIATLWI